MRNKIILISVNGCELKCLQAHRIFLGLVSLFHIESFEFFLPKVATISQGMGWARVAWAGWAGQYAGSCGISRAQLGGLQGSGACGVVLASWLFLFFKHRCLSLYRPNASIMMNMRIAIISVLWWGLERLNSSFEKLTRPKDIFELETSWPPLLTAGFCLHIVVISVHQLIVLSFVCFLSVVTMYRAHYLHLLCLSLLMSRLKHLYKFYQILLDLTKQERNGARTSPE